MRRAPLILLAVLAGLGLAGAGGLLLLDRSREDRVAEGITIAGVPVGGLDREAAISRLEADLVPALRRPLKVDHGKRQWVLGPREARLRTDVVAAVDEAVRRSRGGSPLERGWRALTGDRVTAEITPPVEYSKQAVVRLLDRIRGEVARRPVDAKVVLEGGRPKALPGKAGLEVEASALHRRMRAALASTTADRRLKATTRKVQPKVTMAEARRRYGTYLYADRRTFKLVLYKDLKPVKTYGIAVGAAGQDTPTGLYRIANKAVNPVWSVPNSDWAGELAGRQIPPGPANPIKARWLGIYDGVGIHGTADEGSIGSAASKGCLRMRVRDVVELYPRVPVGTPIYIA
jgi:lipoprotein-anchoring transpeptidase ErfK/SrfK